MRERERERKKENEHIESRVNRRKAMLENNSYSPFIAFDSSIKIL